MTKLMEKALLFAKLAGQKFSGSHLKQEISVSTVFDSDNTYPLLYVLIHNWPCTILNLNCVKLLTRLIHIVTDSSHFLLCLDYGVEITDPTKFELGPSFVEQPEDAKYNEQNNDVKYGNILTQHIEFECFASGNPIPKYTWYKQSASSRNVMDPLQVCNTFIFLMKIESGAVIWFLRNSKLKSFMAVAIMIT